MALDACASASHWRQALHAIGWAQQLRLLPDAACYNSVIAGAARNRRWPAALAVFASMPRPHAAPNAASRNLTLNACALAQEWQRALASLAQWRECGWVPDVIGAGSVVRACAEVSRWRHALALARGLPAEGITMDDLAHSDLARGLDASGQGTSLGPLFLRGSWSGAAARSHARLWRHLSAVHARGASPTNASAILSAPLVAPRRIPRLPDLETAALRVGIERLGLLGWVRNRRRSRSVVARRKHAPVRTPIRGLSRVPMLAGAAHHTFNDGVSSSSAENVSTHRGCGLRMRVRGGGRGGERRFAGGG